MRNSPVTMELLLEALERNGWNTDAFRRPLPSEKELKARAEAPVPSSSSTRLRSETSPRGCQDGNPSSAASATCPAAAPPDTSILMSELVAREAVVAYGKIRPYVRHTPLDPCPWLSDLAGGGCRVWLKMESEQLSGSFKVRGALSKLLSLPPELLSRGVFTASTGNHALAVLHACTALADRAAAAAAPPTSAVSAPTSGFPDVATDGAVSGLQQGQGSSSCSTVPTAPTEAAAAAAAPTHGSTEEASVNSDPSGMNNPSSNGAAIRPVLYVPETASSYKIRKLRALGGCLRLHGTDCLETETAARAAADAAGAVYVSPYNDPWVMAGQGTTALEILADLPRGQLDVVLIPVGGGGLIGGMASVLKAADPNIWVVGCQPAASDVMARSVVAGRILPENEACTTDGWTADGGCTTASGNGGAKESAAAAAAAAATLSDATAGGVEAGSVTLQPCVSCVDEWVVVTEAEIAEALVGLLEQQAKMVEGAAAVALAALQRLAPRLAGRGVVALCCGGNIALSSLRRAMDMARPPRQ